MFKNLFMPLLDADTGAEIGGAGVEAQEVADPVEETETGVEDEEVAEPQDNRTEQDAAFAEMRRQNEELTRRAEQYEAALANFFDGEGDELIVQARALGEEKSEEQIRAEIEAEMRVRELEAQNEALQDANVEFEIERRMAEDLHTLQSIDPSIKSIEEMDETFFNCIGAGLSATDAYYAMKAKEQAQKIVPPTSIGKVNATSEPKDYYTRDEVEAMSKAEIKANYDTIRKSMTKW